jgi:hypothetical protein
MTDSNSVPEIEQPDLKVEYRDADSTAQRPRLIFKLRKGSPVKIRNVGVLISEETYRTANRFVLLQEVIPEVEPEHPVECQISCLRNDETREATSLQDVLEAGGPTVSDSVIVEYEADNNRFSRRFFLHKNADGSIVWSTENRQVYASQDLRALRIKLSSLRNVIDDLIHVGELSALAQESATLESRLIEILQEKAAKHGIINKPMRHEIISLDPQETTLPSWERLRLMSFRDRYNQLQSRSASLSLPSSVPHLPNIPNELTAVEFMRRIAAHRDAVIKVGSDIRNTYAAKFFGSAARATMS